MTVRRAALVATLVAALVYLPALGNRFALDDGAIVERNAAAHSVATAVVAFTHPYWPPEHGAGLWRPLVILSFAVDWQLTGGSPVWLHAVNVLGHAVTTGLVVAVIAPYLSPAGALAGGVIFAVHPLHVEAVANLVGRAELLVAALLMLSMLTARKVRRRAAEGRPTAALESMLLGLVLLALLSKEHAAIAVALLWLDDRARPDAAGRLPVRDYLFVAALTVGWLILRRTVEGGVSFQAVAPTFFHLDAVGRISTMLPAVLVLLRLLVWPFDLSPDYHPLVIERLEHPTAAGVLGLAVLAACVLLALRLWRAHRAASLGLLVIGVAWLPTSNLLFPTGIVLAERTLYLPSVGLALLVGIAADSVLARADSRRAALALLVCAVPLAARTVTRIPDWRSTRDLVVAALLEHPESYKVHQSAARVFLRLGMRPQAVAEYGVAAEIYPLDHYLLAEIASYLVEGGNLRMARRYLDQAERLDSNYTLTQQLLAQYYLRKDSAAAALLHARKAVAGGPDKAEAARMMASSFMALGLPDSALAVWPAFLARGGNRFDRWLLGSVTLATIGRGPSALEALDSAAANLPPRDSIAARRLGEARFEVTRLAGGPR